MDIFVGVSVIAGDYGEKPSSYLLLNDGDGQFSKAPKELFPEISSLGMINDALWADLDGDKKEELILSGDWQKIRVFKTSSLGPLEEIHPIGFEYSAGWIQDIQVGDFNSDGRLDLAVGNLGLNSKLKASIEKPVWLYHHDFDQNGQNDPIIFRYLGERLVPLQSRNDLIAQIPSVKGKHNSYAEYSKISSPEDLFPSEILAKASKMPAYTFESGVYFQNQNGEFDFQAFPSEAQLSPINSISWIEDELEIYLGGNMSGLRVDLGASKANALSILRWDKSGWQTHKSSSYIPASLEIKEVEFLPEKNVILVAGHNEKAYLLPRN